MYIKREAVYEKCGWYNTVNGKSICAARKDEIATIPIADVTPVVHGKWVEYDCFCCNSDGEPVVKTGTVFVCSECGREERYKEPYCHCGAKMDKN